MSPRSGRGHRSTSNHSTGWAARVTALPSPPFGIGDGRDYVRVLPRFDGLELRFGRRVLHANPDLAELIGFVLRSPSGPASDPHSDQLAQLAIDSLTALADAGVAPRVWGHWWATVITAARLAGDESR